MIYETINHWASFDKLLEDCTTEKQCNAIKLRLFWGMTYKEIAEKMGVKHPETIRQLILGGVRSLRKKQPGHEPVWRLLDKRGGP